jgi:hypothetical protein
LSTSYVSFMQPEISLHSQELALGTYPYPEESRPGMKTVDCTSTSHRRSWKCTPTEISHKHIVTYRITARQCHRSSVSCGRLRTVAMQRTINTFSLRRWRNTIERMCFMRSAPHILTRDMFSMESDPSLYNENLLVAWRLEDWNWEFRTGWREWEYNSVQWSTTEWEFSSVVGRR